MRGSATDTARTGFICSKELIKPGFLWALYFANYVFKVSA